MTTDLTPDDLDQIQARLDNDYVSYRDIATRDVPRLLAEGRRLHDEVATLDRALTDRAHEADRRLQAERDALAARLTAVWDLVRDSQAEQTVLDAVQGIVTGALDGGEDRD